ncbi:sensor histidine kinase [Corticibacter populi]|uniref:histidine kinase n=1 Tax=Corticibacter populi TaxID=1550736 RepID=A0A3M6QZ88_9BURK|nr:HAMP domain-containing sensor histidine kinase [Corticibacter populi]RMX07852.1 sensor histidine kinase [Corticibacter populi]RZS35085.1 signal transduction histidine kinase [Corticibacter populi]
MTSKKSIAWRITLALTALIAVAVCMVALSTYYVYRGMQESMIDKLIQTESNRLISRVSRFGATWKNAFERDMGPSMFAWGETDMLRASTMPDALRGLPTGMHYLDRDDSTWHVSVAEVMDGRLYVLYDSVVLEQQSRSFALALAAIVLVFCLLALLISSTVAHWLVTPLNAVADRLARWAPGKPLDGISRANEAERLMEAFNRVQDQVDSAIADQREFSANLHHEIRTPLTVIRSDAELLQRQVQPARLPQAMARLERIIRSVDEIRQSLESTYSITHASANEAEALSLASCVHDITESLSVEAERVRLEIVNSVRSDHSERIVRQALMTVMRNIIRNAMLHAAPARLEIQSIASGMQFTDSGPGIDAHDLPHVFERYFSMRRLDQNPSAVSDRPASREGLYQTGLGLAIAKRVCDMQGWILEVHSPVAQGRGTRFTLFFTKPDDH